MQQVNMNEVNKIKPKERAARRVEALNKVFPLFYNRTRETFEPAFEIISDPYFSGAYAISKPEWEYYEDLTLELCLKPLSRKEAFVNPQTGEQIIQEKKLYPTLNVFLPTSQVVEVNQISTARMVSVESLAQITEINGEQYKIIALKGTSIAFFIDYLIKNDFFVFRSFTPKEKVVSLELIHVAHLKEGQLKEYFEKLRKEEILKAEKALFNKAESSGCDVYLRTVNEKDILKNAERILEGDPEIQQYYTQMGLIKQGYERLYV